MKISRLTIGLGLAAAVSLFGLVEANASPFAMFFLSDDIGNQVRGSAPEASEWENDGGDSGSDTGGGDSGKSNNGHGNNEDGVDSSNPGHDNNGHGNNEDGVDSSNPGNSKAGQDSDPTVDDEMSKSSSGSKGKKK